MPAAFASICIAAHRQLPRTKASGLPRPSFMNILSEELIKIEVWSRPLAKTHYAPAALAEQPRPKDKEGTGILFEQLIEANEANEADEIETNIEDLFNPLDLPEISAPNEHTAADTKAPRSKGIRRFMPKIDIYDYSELEAEALEQKVDELINADGFYNEVVPIDADEDFDSARSINKFLLIVIGGLIVTIIAFILIILTW